MRKMEKIIPKYRCEMPQRKNGTSKDLTGMTFGKWHVMSRAENLVYNSRSQQSMWNCVCECGTERVVSGQSLLRGLSKSCGCSRKSCVRKSRIKDLTGKHFGEWIVIGCSKSNYNGHNIMWTCKCSCGVVKDVNGESLKNGDSKSCGHLRDSMYDKEQDNLVGKKFGLLTVRKRISDKLDNRGYHIARYECICDCGNIVNVSSRYLMYKNNPSCGCIGSNGGYKVETLLRNYKISL